MAARIELRTQTRETFVDITRQVADAVRASSVSDGWAQVFCPHTTAGITINEHADPDVADDIIDSLADIAPAGGRWKHAEGNADAHVKATLVGSSATVPIEDGRLVLGTWQGVFFCEFDGPRSRHFIVTVVGR